jgi:transcriptional regulator with GAF, ATPase, and Fis domain
VPVEGLIGTSQAARYLEQEIDDAARSDAKVLLTGESGVGKEVVARLIHQQSRRRNVKLVALNCAAVPDSLLESELFGHVRGSFTGASGRVSRGSCTAAKRRAARRCMRNTYRASPNAHGATG